MTQREFFTAIAAIEGIDSSLRDFALEGIAKLDKRNSSRQAKPSKAQIENAPIEEAVLALLSAQDEPILTTAIAEQVGVTPSKVTGILGNLFKEGKVAKTDVKVKGVGTRKGWKLA